MNNLFFDQTKINREVGRVTSFTFIFWDQDDYEDPYSSILYWQNYLYTFLESLKVPAAVSPCHRFDINEVDASTGLIEFKKVHWHVVIDFGSGQNKTIKQIFDMIRPIRKYISIAPWDDYAEALDYILDANDVSNLIFADEDSDFEKIKKVWLTCNVVRNMRSLLRYFKHLDNPEKHQYTEDIRSFGGFEVEDRIYSQTDSFFILDQIFDYIEDNHIYSFRQYLRRFQKL